MRSVSFQKVLDPVFLIFLLNCVLIWPGAEFSGAAVYVGVEACRDCHPGEYASFMNYAKKSRSFESIEKLRKGLTEEEIEKCYSCHTTGYGRPGGFVNPEETPFLKNAGCEVCHGPGSDHCASRNPAEIKGVMTTDDCVGCHTSERVKAFRYKPMIHGGAH